MRFRYRKKMIDRQSLFNIHLAKFTAELNQTVEEAYKTLNEFLGSVVPETDNEDENLQDKRLEDPTNRPPNDL